MNQLNLCIPTLKRYDLLNQLIDSVRKGSLLPTAVWVIDNGGKFFEGNEKHFVDDWGIFHHYFKYGYNLGCAASWNRFIQMTDDIRIISNDDILFEENSLKTLVESFEPNMLVCPESIVGGNFFSCFMIPTSVVAQVGCFDEEISPNYCYHEDNDYTRRVLNTACQLKFAQGCKVGHSGSSTLAAMSESERQDHHRKFDISKQNYVKKWGGLPGSETYTLPYQGGK